MNDSPNLERGPVWWSFPRAGAGLVGAAAAWSLGLAPSLLPRPAGIAIALAGLLAALGYGLGCAIARPFRSLFTRVASPQLATAVDLLIALLWFGVVVLTFQASGWQADQSLMLGMPNPAPPAIGLLVAGAAVAWALIIVVRGLRQFARLVRTRVSGTRARVMAPAIGVVSSVVLVAAMVALAYAGIASVFRSIDSRGSGQTAPSSDLRSGGPGSLVRYDSLGTEGQRFVNGAPTTDQLTAYSGQTAMAPIRVFAGLDSAPTADKRAALAVQELRRTGAFDRAWIVVASTTGNGYLDPALVAAPEFLTDGDVATVATQYSVLPSWLSFLVDQKAAGDEAAALWTAVRAAVDALPEGTHPRLAQSGESLGAFGGQAAFAGLTPAQVASQVDVVVWVGSPSASAVWPIWRDSRTGGPVWEPLIGDSSIARDPATADSAGWSRAGWGKNRVALTQHANDPVSWWTPDLILRRPDWLDQPRGPGVDARITWWPGVLFLQTGLDLAGAGSVPAGQGHNYGDVTAQAWAFALGASGAHESWTSEDTDRLNRAITGP